MRMRDERRIQALRDGALSSRVAARLRERIRDDAEAQRLLRSTEGLGRALRALDDAPTGPDPDAWMRRIRAGLREVDAEVERLPAWRRLLDRSGERLRPTLAVGAAATALVLLTLFSPVGIDGPAGPGVARAGTTVRSVRDLGTPVIVLEGGDGTTIIWLVDPDDADLSRTHPFEGLA